MPLFHVTEVDRRFYEERLRSFLPDAIFDIHTHVWLKRFETVEAPASRGIQTWPSRVARDQSLEELVETYRVMLPGKTVTPLIFGSTLKHADDEEGGNAYVAECARQRGFPALLFARPQWTEEYLEARLQAGGFLGVKVYLSLADPSLPPNNIRIFDYLPRHHLDVLNRNGLIAMLHIPGSKRLRDPDNLDQMLTIEDRWPDVKLIIAHVGRAYCVEDLGNAFDALRGTRRIMFDISANTNEEVFLRLIRAIGPRRILFGSDLPITRMRMRRICENGNYVNLVPRGLYGDVSDDPHMREVDGAEADRLTFFLYEELDAFRRAAEAMGLTEDDIADVFYGNAVRVIEDTRRRQEETA